MMATAFLGYEHSPKWFNISISFAIILIIVYYTIQNLVKKNKVLIYPIRNNMKNIKYNKLNNKSTYFLNKRRYSTIPSSNNSIEFTYSERLNSIIKELELNPVYIFENLDSENIRKQILNDTKGLSGIYLSLIHI